MITWDVISHTIEFTGKSNPNYGRSSATTAITTTTASSVTTTTTTKSVDALSVALAEAEKKVKESSKELENKARVEASKSPMDIIRELQQFAPKRGSATISAKGVEVSSLPKFDHVPNWRDLLGADDEGPFASDDVVV
ncbi:hypothetical protein Pmar_PMAR028943 [Perkinsus marinus ATCC 50983]|uniref:Uncharacterized protein n=1 Tax=Perkinsus marinus (strain ATCC 50983 / TXsc) TaxID=423536 RepID=C5KJR5_PERM5|nr:hypothetical protein Pmar_PMAR028943 [Perkinsus marinus ATCC 50983]EER15277.1 hypothetical protein Pmar_PMAR028943 [Perkinsus marinus ATCC 50983]|eukprot:XP_002783481.1 hypothetical protein Pmar_PMAR028943 [Perkinsus marinus ATCC 50983]